MSTWPELTSQATMDWQQIFSVRTGRTLQTVLDMYPDVFKDDLGQ